MASTLEYLPPAKVPVLIIITEPNTHVIIKINGNAMVLKNELSIDLIAANPIQTEPDATVI
jgi:hypothetical protein